jgi:hypothetical protein
MNETTICRTIQVEVKDDGRGYGRRRGGAITTEPAPTGRIATAALLQASLPGKKFEHAARPDSLDVCHGRPQPTSLFFQAVHACFADHHALTLRPEVLMHLIVNEIATTVKMHPEAYRGLFTTSPDKQRIDVRHDGLRLGDPKSPWHEAIAMFSPKLRELVPPGIMDHMLPSFTTATVETQTASLVAFMAAASPFYDYHVHTRCGIPEIRLAGTPDDYRKMLNAAAQLSEVFRPHLGRYFDHLLPVLTTLTSQADGAPVDEAFWRSIYKFESSSGTAAFNGWSAAFVNYVNDAQRNLLVEKPADVFDWQNPGSGWGMRGLQSGSVPSQICTAPFQWHYFNETKKMLFAAGMLAVDEHEGSVMPGLSYAVLHDE